MRGDEARVVAALVGWLESSGWNVETIRDRINEGMTAEQAVTPFKAEADRAPKPSSKPEPVIVSYKGEERTLEGWAEIDWVKRRKITKGKLYARLYQLGWTKEQAFGDETRRRPNAKTLTIQTQEGQVEKTTKEWAKSTGLPLATINARIARGWKPEEILGIELSPYRKAKAAEHEGRPPRRRRAKNKNAKDQK